ncbi:MAG: sensor histidine kinase [Chitinophagaceae bacterium]
MKLLQKTLLTYLVYSIIVVLLAIPIFYGLIRKMFISDVDESLQQRKVELATRLNSIQNPSEFLLYQDLLNGHIILRPAKSLPVRDQFSNLEIYDSTSQEKNPFRQLTTLIRVHGQPYQLTILQSLVDSEDLQQGIVTTQALLLITLLAGLLLINQVQSKRIWRPFYATLEALKKFELDKNPNLGLPSSRIREFQDLHKVITQLTEKNYLVYLQQKEFTENAAHEMQTPLAVFQSKLDLLLQSQSLNQDQADLIHSLTQSSQKLSRLNQCLLLLSKIENHQFVELQNLSVDLIVNRLVLQLEDQIRAKNITLNITVVSSAHLKTNVTLLEMLLSNLISNAIRHNHPNGHIQITLKEKEFNIFNSGSPLSFAEEKIFDRFQKGDQSQKSLGLGLAIAKKICDTSGFKLQYDFENGQHHFCLRF